MNYRLGAWLVRHAERRNDMAPPSQCGQNSFRDADERSQFSLNLMDEGLEQVRTVSGDSQFIENLPPSCNVSSTQN